MTDPLPSAHSAADPDLRAAVIAVLDEHVPQMLGSWADRLEAAGWPDAAAWLRQQVTT